MKGVQVFAHHIYEYQKGVRKLILHTTNVYELDDLCIKLDKKGISYLVDFVNEEKVNIFFGDPDCISVLQRFPSLELYRLSPENDFILGIMLGYDCKLQCQRFIKFSEYRYADRRRVVS